MSQPQNHRYAFLDSLRIIATILVLLYHFGSRSFDFTGYGLHWLQPACFYGYLGVSLFFMISGNVIFASAKYKTSRSFITARFLRLVPSFLIAGIITFITLRIAKVPSISLSFTDLLYHCSLLYLTPFGGWVGSKLHATPIDGAYWSLAIEGTFYMLVAVAIRCNCIKSPTKVLFGWLSVTAFVTLMSLLNINHGFLKLSAAIFITSYSPFFIAGCFFNQIDPKLHVF